MPTYYPVDIRGQNLLIDFKHPIEKKQALSRLRKGDSVYTDRKKASTLATALSDGDTHRWRDDAHVAGGYRHYHDSQHQYAGHIFYGGPH